MGNQLAGRQIHGKAGGRIGPGKGGAQFNTGALLGITAIMAGTDLQPGGEGTAAFKGDLPGGLHPGPEAGHGGIGSRQLMGLLGAGPGPEGVRGEVKRARADGGKLGPQAGRGHLPGGIGSERAAHLRLQCHLAGAMAECGPRGAGARRSGWMHRAAPR